MGKENCAYTEMTYYPAWQDANCAVTLEFICKTVAGVAPPTTAPAHGLECLEMKITAMHSSLLTLVTLRQTVLELEAIWHLFIL